jgi:hypothetical protein
MQKEEDTCRYKIIHIIPDIQEEEREEIKQKITQKIYNLFSNREAKD